MNSKPTQSLQLRQSQSLVMTAQLQQSIKLLQLSALDLNAFVEEELEKNPLLARDESAENPGDGEPVVGADALEQERATQDESFSEKDSLDLAATEKFAESSDPLLDTQHGEGWQDGDLPENFDRLSVCSAEKTGIYSHKEGGGLPDLEQTLSADISLRDHLLEQLQVDITDAQQRLIGSQLIDMVDESGYLREDISSLVEILGATQEMIESTIALLQRFDPPGTFARDLKECLKLQLIDRNLYDPFMQRLVEHIDLMGRGEVKQLQKLCGVDDEDFAEMLAELRLLKPKPASDFIHDVAQPVVPDVFVRRGKQGVWQVELNHDILPRVLLNQHYFSELSEKSRCKEDKKYLSEQMANASWLVKALDQRARTILRVSSEIVTQQQQFFLYGIQFLRPLTLKDIALQVEMHESTISRVTSNKYIATPRGIFELKYFFTSSISSSGGEADISSKTVMYYIKELIDAEAADDVLSDDTIVNQLKARNIDVARRTVAKYREAMNIPSSVIRRRLKRA